MDEQVALHCPACGKFRKPDCLVLTHNLRIGKCRINLFPAATYCFVLMVRSVVLLDGPTPVSPVPTHCGRVKQAAVKSEGIRGDYLALSRRLAFSAIKFFNEERSQSGSLPLDALLFLKSACELTTSALVVEFVSRREAPRVSQSRIDGLPGEQYRPA